MKRLALLLALAGCQDALDQRLAIVREPRVLAITAEPPEGLPGAQVTLAALVASPDGPLAVAPAWALCTAPKPPTEDNAVADPCVTGDQLIELGTAPTVTAAISSDACIRFGPDVPPGGFRPRDPDPTGGYYQPVRAEAPGADLAFGFARVTCKLGSAPSDVAHDYQLHYAANANPTLAPLELRVAGAVVAPDAVPAGAAVTLVASWPSVESYLYYDPDAQVLVTRREAMRVSWFATGGELAVDATAVAEADPATTASTTWTAPTAPGPAWLWLVLRDSRGGLATQTVPITLR